MFAVQAIMDFKAQDWPHKHLTIVNSTGHAFSNFNDTTEIVAPPECADLWEFGLSKCQGEWVADWQDDCHYDRRYLHAMARLRSKDKRVSLLAYGGVCLDDKSKVNVENDGTMFNLTFRFATKLNGEPTWLDKRDLAFRYYASKVTA